MSKKGIVLLAGVCFFLLILSFTASAATVEKKVIMSVPGSVVMNGKNISVLGIQSASISVDVDGVLDIVEEDNSTKSINGVFLRLIGVSRGVSKAILHIKVKVVCGDGKCSAGEDSKICCKDCGCLSSSLMCLSNRCVENITKVGAANECNSDNDCKTNSTCMTATCDASAYPSKCKEIPITVCKGGDKCCPETCDTPQDKDCKEINKCETNADCNDNNACTTDTCQGKPKRCKQKAATGCALNNECVVEGTIDKGKYCYAASGEWVKQKADQSACEADHECFSLTCTWKKCGEIKTNFLPSIFVGAILFLVVVIGLYMYLAVKRGKD